MNYLISKNRDSKKKVHLWNNEDTYCKMYSTGGLSQKKYIVSDNTENKEICQMCKNVQNGLKFEKTTSVVETICNCNVLPWIECEHSAEYLLKKVKLSNSFRSLF